MAAAYAGRTEQVVSVSMAAVLSSTVELAVVGDIIRHKID
jgi:hypothetical protein